MISPIQIKIKGYPRNDTEDFDKRSLIPIQVRITDYPIFHYFGPNNPLLFNINYSYKSSAIIKLNVKPSDPAKSNIFFLDASAKARFIIKGNFDYSVFGFDNKLKATSNYFIRDGFANHSSSLLPKVLLKVLIPAGNLSSSSGSSIEITDCYQIKANLLRDWDDKTLSEMDNLTNENIAGSIV